MRKSPSRSRSPKRAANPAGDSEAIANYFSRVPEPAKSTLQAVRAAILSACPNSTIEAISYGIPTFKNNGNICAIAAFKAHCSFFPMSGYILGKFSAELARFEVSKGTVRFPIDQPLPASLVKKIIKARLAQMSETQKTKSAR